MDCVNGLLQYFTNLEKDFHHYYVDVLRDGAEEAIHQLRLNMKKQTAFFHLLEYLDPSFSTERALEAYDQLYKKAGKVRNIQVERSIVRREEKLLKLERAFSQWLDGRARERTDQLLEYGSEFSLLPVRRLASLVRSRINFLPAEHLRDQLQAYFGQLFTAVRKQAPLALLEEAQIHPLRKLIKELFFNIHLLNSLCTKKGLTKKDIKAVDDLQHLLGQWHDSFFALARIYDGEEPCPEKMLRHLEKKRAGYLKRIQAKLDALPLMIDELEKKLNAVLLREEVALPPPTAEPPKKRKTRPSYTQLNAGERTK